MAGVAPLGPYSRL